MNHADVVARLTKRKGKGSWRSLARVIGCSAMYLCDIVNGRRNPGPKVLEFLGLKSRTVIQREYTRKP
jgi:hypothetical protein